MTDRYRRVPGGKGSVVPPAEVRSYYDQPIIRGPVWTWEIPAYFFFGGAAGASATLSAVAHRAGWRRLGRIAATVAAAGAVLSPPLLIADLGRPGRFHHMLRVFKPTSPMNMGTWILSVFAPAAIAAAALEHLERLPRVGSIARALAATLGPAMATYTAVVLSDTAVPVWHEARRDLPAVFAASSAAAAGAAAVIGSGAHDDSPARRLAVGGAVAELVAVKVMEARLGDSPGDLASAYRRERAQTLSRIARGATAGGAVLTALAGRRRGMAMAGAGLVLTGSATLRFAVMDAGRVSANDPAYIVSAQRGRIAE